MAVFKFVVSQGNKSFQIEKEHKDCPVIGKKIGDIISGDFLGLGNSQILIRGGSDKNGFPMRPEVRGTGRKNLLLTRGVGFKENKKGLRKRKHVRGNTISDEIVQINCKILKSEKKLEDIFNQKNEETTNDKSNKG